MSNAFHGLSSKVSRVPHKLLMRSDAQCVVVERVEPKKCDTFYLGTND